MGRYLTSLTLNRSLVLVFLMSVQVWCSNPPFSFIGDVDRRCAILWKTFVSGRTYSPPSPLVYEITYWICNFDEEESTNGIIVQIGEKSVSAHDLHQELNVRSAAADLQLSQPNSWYMNRAKRFEETVEGLPAQRGEIRPHLHGAIHRVVLRNKSGRKSYTIADPVNQNDPRSRAFVSFLKDLMENLEPSKLKRIR